MTRKPAPQAGQTASSRAFALPEEKARPAAEPRRDDAAHTRREKAGRPDDAPGSTGPGQGAAHRSARAAAVAQGEGTGQGSVNDTNTDEAAPGKKAGDSEATSGRESDGTVEDAAKQAETTKPDAEAQLAGQTGAADAMPVTADMTPSTPQPIDPQIAALLSVQIMPAVAAEDAATETDEEPPADQAKADGGEQQPAGAVQLALPADAQPAVAAAPDEGTGTPAANATPASSDPSTGTAPASAISSATQGATNAASEQAAPANAASPPDLAQALKAEAPTPTPAPTLAAPALPRAGDILARVEANQPQGLPTAPESRPTPVQGVPMEVGFRSLEGHKRFDIRLDPGELGRVEVRLDISDEGAVKATLTVERAETLHMMQRETRALERALEQAGFRPSDGSIDLRLSDRAPDRQRDGERDPSQPRPQADDPADAEAVRLLHPAQLARYVAGATGGVDLVI